MIFPLTANTPLPMMSIQQKVIAMGTLLFLDLLMVYMLGILAIFFLIPAIALKIHIIRR